MLNRLRQAAAGALLALTLTVAQAAGVATGAATIPAMISGAITGHEHGALPPDSTAVVQLLDSGRAGAVIAEQRLAITGQGPLAYRLDYDAVSIDPRGSYVVSARIEHGGQVLFVNEAATPVITRGSPGQADLVLKKAPPAKP